MTKFDLSMITIFEEGNGFGMLPPCTPPPPQAIPRARPCGRLGEEEEEEDAAGCRVSRP